MSGFFEAYDGPVHQAFGLTYARYFVLRRSLMQAMPHEWQERFVKLIDEFWETFDAARADHEFGVQLRDERGRFASDDLAEYRHPNRATIESLMTERAGAAR